MLGVPVGRPLASCSTVLFQAIIRSSPPFVTIGLS